MSECQTKAGNQNTLTHSVTLSLSHFHTITLSLSYSLTLDMLNNFCFHVYAQKSLSHSLTLSRNAEQLLFSCLGSKVTVYSRKLQWFFFDRHSLTTLSCEFGSHRAGSQLKRNRHITNHTEAVLDQIYPSGPTMTSKYQP